MSEKQNMVRDDEHLHTREEYEQWREKIMSSLTPEQREEAARKGQEQIEKRKKMADEALAFLEQQKKA